MADRIGITGATGFVGRALTHHLLGQGREDVRLFGREAATVSGLAVQTPGAGELAYDFAGLDCVVHLAGITTSRATIDELRRVNVDMAADVARSAVHHGVRRLVFMSSLHVHGKTSSDAVGPESPLHPDNAYGQSKAEAEAVVKAIADQAGMALVILRPPMIYGPDSKGSFPLLARLVATGLPLPFAAARGRRSFCSIDNLLSALDRALDGPVGPGALIPADPVDFHTPALVGAMAQAQGRRARMFVMPRALLAAPLALIGRAEMVTSLFDPLRIDRSHWTDWNWQPKQSGPDAVRQALTRPSEDRPLVLYVTNTTPYFLSHRILLAREAKRRGFRVAVAGSDVNDHVQALAAEGITPVRIAGVSRGVSPAGDLMASRELATAIRRLAPDVVHATGLKVMFLCALAGFQVRLPRVVCIVTGLGGTYVDDHLRARVLRRGIEAVLRPLLRRRRTMVIFQNGDDHAYFLERGVAIPDNSLVIKGSGVDVHDYPFTPQPTGSPPLIVFPARLLVSKGVRQFAGAAALLRNRGVSARFALVGDLDPGNSDAITADELATFVRDGIEAWGFRQDMQTVFSQSHIVCMPSFYREGVPKALIEAASCGRPIVTADVPGCREIVIDGLNGLLVPPRTVPALADALERLISNAPLRAQMGAAGRRLVEAEFSTDAVIGRTADTYQG